MSDLGTWAHEVITILWKSELETIWTIFLFERPPESQQRDDNKFWNFIAFFQFLREQQYKQTARHHEAANCSYTPNRWVLNTPNKQSDHSTAGNYNLEDLGWVVHLRTSHTASLKAEK